MSYSQREFEDKTADETQGNDYELDFILDFAESEEFDLNSMRQLRALWSAYVLHEGLSKGTEQYKRRIEQIWEVISENPSCPFSSLESGRFSDSMGAFL